MWLRRVLAGLVGGLVATDPARALGGSCIAYFAQRDAPMRAQCLRGVLPNV
jgi:hypothetical protein